MACTNQRKTYCVMATLLHPSSGNGARLQPKAQTVRAPNQDVVEFCSFRKLRFLLCKRPLDRLSFGATVFQQNPRERHRGTMLRYLHRVSSGAPDRQNEDRKPIDTCNAVLNCLAQYYEKWLPKDLTMMNNILLGSNPDSGHQLVLARDEHAKHAA